MLTYSFSTREKILVTALGIALVVVAWYRFVFLNIQGQITETDAKIATAQEQVLAYQTRAAQLEGMRNTIEEYQKEGKKPTYLPTYDNTQSLMAYLHSVLGSTKGYDISFENPAYSEEDQTVHRNGTISYETAGYAEARAVVEAIARGPYPCEITAFSTDEKQDTSSSSLVITFFEALPEGVTINSEDGSAEGQDLSVLINRE